MNAGALGTGFVAIVLLAFAGMLRLINPPHGTLSDYQRRATFVAGILFAIVAAILELIAILR